MGYNYCLFYGTLRFGEPNWNRVIAMFGKDSMKYVNTQKLSNHSLYSIGAYPIAIPNDDAGDIVCDLVAVSKEAEKFIDDMEKGAGYTPYVVTKGFAGVDNIYATREITIYVYEEHEEREVALYGDLIESGDWIKFNTKSAIYVEN